MRVQTQTTVPEFQRDIPLSRHTTIGLGGPARYFVDCASLAEIRGVLDESARLGLPLQVVGGGSNLIFPDDGYAGIVMRIGLSGIEWIDDGPCVISHVMAGERWDEFVRSAVARRLSGIECLSGIPGSVGAVPIQNVGAYGQEVTETIIAVHAIDRTTGAEREFSNAECEFGYRMSRFKARDANRWIVTRVSFRLRKDRQLSRSVYPELKRYLESQTPGALSPQSDSAEVLTLIREAVLALRRKKSMVIDPSDPDTRSVGSYFMNPIVTPARFREIEARWLTAHPSTPIPSFQSPGSEDVKIPAAWLIEHAGFQKGYRRGGVGISSHHTLALVNYGGTTAELFALENEIRAGVQSVFGFVLEREAIAVE
ncbi:MAG TPA: UDP-N-acetylmuramate dehydrogenase [Bacteroidota bacterium]|nr:UDP-N-acetylmuramate dehydrogenase [Bacteroidota bacterium]